MQNIDFLDEQNNYLNPILSKNMKNLLSEITHFISKFKLPLLIYMYKIIRKN